MLRKHMRTHVALVDAPLKSQKRGLHHEPYAVSWPQKVKIGTRSLLARPTRKAASPTPNVGVLPARGSSERPDDTKPLPQGPVPFLCSKPLSLAPRLPFISTGYSFFYFLLFPPFSQSAPRFPPGRVPRAHAPASGVRTPARPLKKASRPSSLTVARRSTRWPHATKIPDSWGRKTRPQTLGCLWALDAPQKPEGGWNAVINPTFGVFGLWTPHEKAQTQQTWNNGVLKMDTPQKPEQKRNGVIREKKKKKHHLVAGETPLQKACHFLWVQWNTRFPKS